MSSKKKTIKVEQVKSAIRRPKNQKNWLLNLGFTKMHQVREFEDTPANRGLINKISHLLRIVD